LRSTAIFTFFASLSGDEIVIDKDSKNNI
jgi:hypothetical protein